MPISEFEISSLGPIKYAKAENLPSLVVIAGPNGVGKSTLLEAIKKNQGKIMGTGKRLYIPPHRAPVAFNLHKNLPVLGPTTRYIDVLMSDSFGLSIPGISLPYFITSSTPRNRISPDFAPYFEVKYKLGQLERELERTVFEIFKKFEEIPKGTLSPDIIYRPLRELIKRLLPGIEFDRIALEGDSYKVYFKNRRGESVEFDYLSSGEKDIIALLFPFIEHEIENELAKFKGEQPTHEDLVVLIDTPEAYLHSTLQRRLLEYIRASIKAAHERNEKLQFIVATHSTTIISEANPEELFALVFPDQAQEGNQLIKITTTKEKKALIVDFLGDIGLVALFSGKPIIILEGPSDVELLKILFPKLDEKFTLIPLYGKGKIQKLTKEFKALINEFRERGFKVFAIMDRDYQQFKEAEEEWCFIWSRSCIENFLLDDAEVIFEALKITPGEIRMREKGINNPSDVATLIDKILTDNETIQEELRRRIESHLDFHIGNEWKDFPELQKLAQQIFSTKMERVERLHEELSRDLLEIVKDKPRALIELNGKMIVNKIAKRFDVSMDDLSRAIADKMRSLNKVPKDMVEIILHIEKTAT